MNRFCCIAGGFVLTALSMTSCHRNQGVLSGSFEHAAQDTLILQELGGGGLADTLILSDGSFKIRKKLDAPAFYELTLHGQRISVVAEPGVRVRITGDLQNLIASYRISGSEAAEQLFDLNQRMRKTLAVKDSLDVLFRRVANLPGNDRYRKLLLEAYTRELESLRQYNMDFIRRNKQSVVALYSLYQQVGPQTYVFSQEEDFKYFQMVDSCLAPRYPKVPLVNMLHRNVQEMGEQLRQRNLEQMLVGLGEPAPAFSAQGADGRAIHLSDLSGKYVLLVFWTSWNASCREFNKTLLSVYQKFKDEGLEIFQVSFDYTYAAWQQAVEEDGLVWKNGWEPQGTGSATARQYRVENLPVYLLIDPEGTVIARQLRPEQLIKKLEDVFHPQS